MSAFCMRIMYPPATECAHGFDSSAPCFTIETFLEFDIATMSPVSRGWVSKASSVSDIDERVGAKVLDPVGWIM